ncbi:MAG: metallophosphoesterase, partial [Eubacteriales bacterium]|nr:metallophosphoesterase [Eubacteriales bacterium]
MKKILLFLLAALAALCGCGTECDVKIDMDSDADINTGVSVETPADTAVYVSQAAGGDIPVLRFAAASDVHIKEYDSVERTRFADLFGDTYAYCETQVYKKLDAVVIIGDFTDNGTAAQYDAFNEVARANIREETQLIVFMGNHEWGSGDERVFTEKTGMEPNSDSVIKGFHFIGVSPVGSDYSSRFDRLGRRLKATAEEDPARPIFT